MTDKDVIFSNCVTCKQLLIRMNNTSDPLTLAALLDLAIKQMDEVIDITVTTKSVDS